MNGPLSGSLGSPKIFANWVQFEIRIGVLTGPPGAKGDTGAQGIHGPTGATGTAGAQGPAGVGVPPGGTANQVLAKTSGTDYATAWQTPTVYLTQATADARYEPIDTMYTKAESDAKYALASALTAALARISTLEGQVSTLMTQMAGHWHDAGDWDALGGTVFYPPAPPP